MGKRISTERQGSLVNSKMQQLEVAGNLVKILYVPFFSAHAA